MRRTGVIRAGMTVPAVVRIVTMTAHMRALFVDTLTAGISGIPWGHVGARFGGGA